MNQNRSSAVMQQRTEPHQRLPERATAMTDALTRLADAVEAGMATSADFRAAFPAGNGHDSGAILAAYNGSLDAAKALHDAALPGWRLTNLCQFEAGHWYARIHHPQGDDWPKWEAYPFHETTNADPARAWLLAIIRALAQVQG